MPGSTNFGKAQDAPASSPKRASHLTKAQLNAVRKSVRRLVGYNRAEEKLLLHIWFRSRTDKARLNGRNGTARTHAELAKLFGYKSTKTIQRAMNALLEKNLITTSRGFFSGKNMTRWSLMPDAQRALDLAAANAWNVHKNVQLDVQSNVQSDVQSDVQFITKGSERDESAEKPERLVESAHEGPDLDGTFSEEVSGGQEENTYPETDSNTSPETEEVMTSPETTQPQGPVTGTAQPASVQGPEGKLEQPRAGRAQVTVTYELGDDGYYRFYGPHEKAGILHPSVQPLNDFASDWANKPKKRPKLQALYMNALYAWYRDHSLPNFDNALEKIEAEEAAAKAAYEAEVKKLHEAKAKKAAENDAKRKAEQKKKQALKTAIGALPFGAFLALKDNPKADLPSAPWELTAIMSDRDPDDVWNELSPEEKAKKSEWWVNECRKKLTGRVDMGEDLSDLLLPLKEAA